MAIELAGNRIIRALKGGRTMITESNGGLTLTKVLDSSGRELVNRAKKIERVKVGDKDVVRRTDVKKVNVYKNFAPEKSQSIGFKTVSDRVFENGECKGARLVEYKPERVSVLSGFDPLQYINNSVRYVTKSDAGTFVNYTKQITAGTNKTFHKKANMAQRGGIIKPQYRSSLTPWNGEEKVEIGERLQENEKFFGNIAKRTHNDKGLPLPWKCEENEKVLDYDKMRKMSLKEMRKEWFDKTQAATEYSRAMNLDKLNNVKEFSMEQVKDPSAPLNNLAQYI